MSAMVGVSKSKDSRVWGDGFESDSWVDICAVRSWDDCSTDEMIRVFPALARDDIPIATSVQTRIRDCIAVLAQRNGLAKAPSFETLSADAAAGPVPKGSRRADPSLCQPWSGFVRWLARGKRHPDRDELSALIMLDAIACEIASGRLRDFDPDIAADVVSWTGIHPVYLWPEALLAHGCYTAIGWIAYAERACGALMSRDIAEYFSLNIVSRSNGIYEIRDSQLARYISGTRMAGLILAAAGERLRGDVRAVRLPRSGGPSTKRCLN